MYVASHRHNSTEQLLCAQDHCAFTSSRGGLREGDWLEQTGDSGKQGEEETHETKNKAEKLTGDRMGLAAMLAGPLGLSVPPR